MGRGYVILKNPIGLNYYRIPSQHAAAAKLFDGRQTFRKILKTLREENRYWRALSAEQAMQELGALAQQLAMSGLLRVHGGSAVARAKRVKDFKKNHLFELAIGKVLYFRKSLFDPDRLLAAMEPWFRWLYTLPLMLAAGVFLLVTLLAACRHWDEITVQATNFFTFENLALSWVLFFGVKIIHEFGHGLTCKKFGGEVHEMGFMFILFTPYLFCNVSDSWLAKKSHRIYVTAAGIVVELILAAVATWLWLGSQPGLFNQMCFNAMFLCSISTILFNANPLLKFDGYYIMTDLLEIPNLKQKSNTYVTQAAQRLLLGVRSSSAKLSTHEMNPLFGIYAVASYAYGWLILYNISWLLFDKLKPYGLEVLSRTYVGLFLFTSLALPLYRFAMSAKNVPDLSHAATKRLGFSLLALVAIGAGLFIIPWQDTIKRTIVIEHASTAPLAPKETGFLRELLVSEGQQVRAGDVVARIEDEEILAKHRDLELQGELAEIRYRSAISSDRSELQLAASAHRKMVQEIEEELKGVRRKIQNLELRAPYDGVVREWNLHERIGLHFAKGHPVVSIGEKNRLRAIIPLNERQARRVAAGQEVRFRLLADPGREFRGIVTALPVSPLAKFTAPVVANLFGGDVPAEQDPEGPPGSVKPSIPYFEAEVTFDNEGTELRPGMMGKARIIIENTTLGHWLVENTIELMNPEFRL